MFSSWLVGSTRCTRFGAIISNSRFCSTIEYWKEVPGFPQYHVSSFGNVKNVTRDRLKTPHIINNYSRVTLCRSGKIKNLMIHRIVLQTFCPHFNCDALQVNHKDGNRRNNNLENLQWCTPSENVAHSRQNGYVPYKCGIKVTNVKSGAHLIFDSCRACHKFVVESIIDVTQNAVHKWVMRRKVTHGYRFEYVDPQKYENRVQSLNAEQWKLFYINEKWKRKYFISNLGRMKYMDNKGNERLRRACTTKDYEIYSLNCKHITVHRLVATHFVPNPKEYYMIDHIDSDRRNNKAENLRWVADHKQNMQNPRTKQKMIEGRRAVAKRGPPKK